MRTVADVEAYLQRSGHPLETFEDGHTFVLRDRSTGQPVAIRVEGELNPQPLKRVALPGRNAQGAIPAREVGDAESEHGQGGRQQHGEKQVPRHDCPVGSAHRHHQPGV